MLHPAGRGRAASIAIARRIGTALGAGAARTYQELADDGGVTVRTVRNYLAHAPQTLAPHSSRSAPRSSSSARSTDLWQRASSSQ
jgi:hypothetical protein